MAAAAAARALARCAAPPRVGIEAFLRNSPASCRRSGDLRELGCRQNAARAPTGPRPRSITDDQGANTTEPAENELKRTTLPVGRGDVDFLAVFPPVPTKNSDPETSIVNTDLQV
jgi:hypothetical protein